MEDDGKKTGRTYGIICVVSLFALALFWSVDSSFRWIFFGAAVAFGFIYLLKRRIFDFKLTDFVQQPHQSQRARRYNSPQIAPLTNSQKGALYFGVGTLIALIVSFAIYAVSTGFEDPASEEQTLEVVPETTYSSSDNADDVLEQGNGFYNNSQFDSALVYYKRALALRPGFKEAIYNVALIYSSQSDYSNAISVLRECLERYPDYGEGLQLMGYCYVRQEQNDEALTFYERAYATGTRNAELSHYLAYLYDLKNNTVRAIEFYKEAIQQDSSKVEVYKRLAELEPEKAEWYNGKAEAWSGNK